MNPMQEGLYETVKSWLTDQELRFLDHDTRPVITVPFRTELGAFDLVADMSHPSVVLFGVIAGFRIPENAMGAAAEFVCRANAHLVLGGFQLEYEHKTVWYKLSGYFEDACATPGEIGVLAQTALQMMGLHLPGLLAVTYGRVCPEEALAECQRRAGEMAAGGNDQNLTEEDFRRLLGK